MIQEFCMSQFFLCKIHMFIYYYKSDVIFTISFENSLNHYP